MSPKKPRDVYRTTHTLRTKGGTVTANLDLYVKDWDRLILALGAAAMVNKTGRAARLWGLIEVRASAITHSAAPDPRIAALPSLDLEDIPF